jgi:hydrogenase maturation protease
MARVLIIGYGNTLRGDDGAGVRAAEALTPLLPECRCFTAAQLSAEHAEDLANADLAILLDADVRAQTVTFRTVEEGRGAGEPRSHSASPEFLLDLCRRVYGRVPERLVVAGIPAATFEFSEELTPRTSAAVDECVRRVVADVHAFLAAHPA